MAEHRHQSAVDQEIVCVCICMDDLRGERLVKQLVPVCGHMTDITHV